MTTTAARLAVGAAALSFVALGAAPAVAQSVCDPYSQECLPAAQDTGVQSAAVPPAAQQPAAVSPQVRPRAAAGPATLPFTGGEVVLIATLGAVAVGGGVALVVAGRRRQVPVA